MRIIGDGQENRDDSNKEEYMRHSIGASSERRGVRGIGPSDTREEWITAKQLAAEYHVGRSTAYEAFKRLDTIRIGGCVRARRSEVEERLRRDGRI